MTIKVTFKKVEDNADEEMDCPSKAYPDVDRSAWYHEAVDYVLKNGLMSGYSDQTFGPDDPITREQLAVILWRWAGSPASSYNLDGFSDQDQISAYALEAVSWAVEKGIVKGNGSGALDPHGKATRAQVAQMMINYLEMK